MSTELMIPAGFAAPSTKLAASTVAPSDLGAGIGAAFAVISYKGKVWSIKHRGESKPLMRPDGTGPQGSIETVIVKASPVISKIFYANGFKEGDNAAPDCWSVNGVSPDPASSAKQSNTCAGCPKNAWGSRITESGKSGKACSDSKRIAVVPSVDLKNDLFGGPMLLRIPAASLQGLSQYAAALQAMGHAYYGVVTEIGFDYREAFPLLTFKAKRVLTDDEVDDLLVLQNAETTNRILNEAVDQVKAEVAQPGASAATVAGMAPAAVTQPVPPPVVVQPPPVVVQPVIVTPPPVVAAAAVPPNPFAGGGTGAPLVDPPRPAPVVTAQPAPQGPNPFATAPAAAPVVAAAQPAPVVVVQPVAPAAVAGVEQPLTIEQKLARAEAALAAMQAEKLTPSGKPRKVRTPNPSPAPTGVIEGTATVILAGAPADANAALQPAPVATLVPPQVTTAPMAVGVNPQAITDLEAQLDALTGV